MQLLRMLAPVLPILVIVTALAARRKSRGLMRLMAVLGALTFLAIFGEIARAEPVFVPVAILVLGVQLLRWPRQEEKYIRLMANNWAFYGVMGIGTLMGLQILILGLPEPAFPGTP